MIGKTKYRQYLLPGVICIFVCWIRGSMIGSYPCTDEGIWAYYSMITNHVINTESELTVEGYINLYPTICSFIFNLETKRLKTVQDIRFIYKFNSSKVLSIFTIYLSSKNCRYV